jgi:hypothetical protein
LTFLPRYIEVVDPILYTWVTVSIFGLLIAIGFKKRNGLWSRQQQPQQPQQQGFIANGSGGATFGAAYGQGLPNPPAYIVYQQPAHAELTGNAAPASIPELPNARSPNLSQQYYWTQHQQHSPFVQNQTQNTAFVPAPVEVAAQPYMGVQMDVAPGVHSSGTATRLPIQQQPPVTQVYEVAGTLDQKG